MIKLINILKEISNNLRTVNLDNVKFYHGTVQHEIKNPSELNPLFRESPEYKKMQDNGWTRKSYGSSYSGVGIYFGRTPSEDGTEDAKQYYDPKRNANRGYTRGFLYEMTLKSNSKVVVLSSFANLSKKEYEELRAQGVDAVAEGSDTKSAINLINPDVVASWKEVDRWEQPFNVYLYKFNESTNIDERVEEKVFWNFDEVESYIKKYFKEPDSPIVPFDKEYQSKDPNNLYMIMVRRPEIKHK